jgi:hypothetical protein
MYEYIGSETKENITGENYTVCIFISIKPKCVRWAEQAVRMEKMRTANEIMAGHWQDFVNMLMNSRFHYRGNFFSS